MFTNETNPYFQVAGIDRMLANGGHELASQTANDQRLQALQVMENLMQSHPRPDRGEA